jgi:hypothetical protein
MRISARLDESCSRKLEFLARKTRAGTTEVVKEAIDRYYREVRTEEAKPAEVLKRSGFIGLAEGPPDLSRRYKEDLFELLEAKHGHR